MALTEPQKQIADRVAHLLAESLLDDEIKDIILEGMDRLPTHLIIKLQDALEAEREDLKRVAFEIQMFLDGQQEDWQALESQQKVAADQLVDKYAQKIEDEIKVKQLKESI